MVACGMVSIARAGQGHEVRATRLLEPRLDRSLRILGVKLFLFRSITRLA